MRHDWSSWTIYLNANRSYNWGIGVNYYHEYNYVPTELLARIFQIDLLFFNITITRWESRGWGK
jgi:hypothetical protein